jgi:hypothetical protein
MLDLGDLDRGGEMSKDDNPTIVEIIGFLRALTDDACSLIRADWATLMATVDGAPERFSDVSARIAQGRRYLRSLDRLFDGAEDRICDAAERA